MTAPFLQAPVRSRLFARRQSMVPTNMQSGLTGRFLYTITSTHLEARNPDDLRSAWREQPQAGTTWPVVAGGEGGIGGNNEVIWSAEQSDQVAEYETSGFVRLRQANGPRTTTVLNYGCGGDADVAWYADAVKLSTVGKLWELSPVDFSVVMSLQLALFPRGIGGDASVVWSFTRDPATADERTEERSVVDFSIVRLRVLGAESVPLGIGGDSSYIWACGGVVGTGFAQEISTTDLTVVHQVTTANPQQGAGG